MPDDDDGGKRTWRSLLRSPVILITLALVGVILVGSVVYYLFFRPAPVTLAPQIVVIPLPTPTVSMTPLPKGTDFIAALPTSDLTYGLTAADEMPASAHARWPVRFAEGWTLTYSDGSGGTMTVEAYQHYHEADAIAAFETIVTDQEEAMEVTPSPSPSGSPSPSASPSASSGGLGGLVRTPVMANGVQVGESVEFSTTIVVPGADEGATPTTRDVTEVVWRNLTGVFVMVADPTVIDDLFVEYGV